MMKMKEYMAYMCYYDQDDNLHEEWEIGIRKDRREQFAIDFFEWCEDNNYSPLYCNFIKSVAFLPERRKLINKGARAPVILDGIHLIFRF